MHKPSQLQRRIVDAVRIAVRKIMRTPEELTPPAVADNFDFGQVRPDETEVFRLILAAARQRKRLRFDEIQQFVSPTAGGASKTTARLYMHMTTDAPDGDGMEERLLDSMTQSEDWSELLTEALTNLPFTPAISRVVVGVLRAKVPGHPCTFVDENQRFDILRAYDAVDDGNQLRLHHDAGNELGGARAVCLMGIEDPVSAWATCSITENDGRSITLSVDRGGPLFSEGRYVLPPAVLITQRN